jgi:hypothetical protein
MATRLHAFDQGCPRQAEVIDLTLAIVDAGDEERRLCTIPIKQIQQIAGVTGRAIVEGQRDGSGNRA